jgi:hypothetical protein
MPTSGLHGPMTSSSNSSGSSNSLSSFDSQPSTSHQNTNTNDDNNEAVFFRSSNNHAHQAPNQHILNQIRSFSHLNNRNEMRQQPLPNVNINQLQRTITYASPRQRAIVPQGFFQWSMYLVSFPFRFIFATLLDVASFFCEFIFLKSFVGLN